MNSVDRERIVELLQDESRSLRDIAREAGCSDWTVRSIDRQVRGDPRPMKRARRSLHRDQERAGFAGWAVGIGFVAVFIALLWYAVRGSAHPD